MAVPPTRAGSGRRGARRERGGKMAGHCGAMAAPLRQRAAGRVRWVCSAAAPRPWRLFGAMCLLRLPRITQPLEKEEEEMAALMQQIELEKSHYSDHEIRKLEEEEQLKRRKESSYDEDEASGKTVIMAQDLEEKWEQKFLRFKAAPRITGTAWSLWWVRTPRLFAKQSAIQ
uniref:Large ribosomal subunit protein mL46 N-terminal domain-containing protein n=1 Tax=Malurus cyaneus samueli TaxID=2593467 RepID=A0A8C5UI00_9PASS